MMFSIDCKNLINFSGPNFEIIGTEFRENRRLLHFYKALPHTFHKMFRNKLNHSKGDHTYKQTAKFRNSAM